MINFIQNYFDKSGKMLKTFFPAMATKSEICFQLNAFKNLQDVKELFLNRENPNKVFSNNTILPGNTTFCTTISFFSAQAGRPLFHFKNPGVKNHHVLFYLNNSGDDYKITQYHFLNQVMFYAEDLYLSTSSFNHILAAIGNDHGIQNLKKHQTIVDNYGNNLSFCAKDSFKVKYYSANYAIYDNLQKQVWGLIKNKEVAQRVFIPALG